ncbi:MAG TPA: VWA domain-containing protein [Thermoanaerobaculia bacterium]|nr:VWA domain-containing protein [Thermoanaerobaculia bacterium]
MATTSPPLDPGSAARHRRRARRLAVGIAFLPVAVALPGHQAAPPIVTSQTSVTAIELPVEVHRGSAPVRGLGAEHFEVWEDGRRLPIVGVEVIDLTLPAAAPGPASPAIAASPPTQAGRRHVLLLFDLGFTEQHRLLRTLVGARTVVAGGLHRSDLVGVALFLPRGEIALLQTFTSDRSATDATLAALEAAIRGDAPGPSGDAAADPLQLTGLGLAALATQARVLTGDNVYWQALDDLLFAGSAGGGKGGFLTANILAHSGEVVQYEVEESRRSRARAMGRGITALEQALRAVEGRKYLLLFSQGFELGAKPARGNAGSAGHFSSTLVGELQRTVDGLRRSGWVVHAIDASGTEGSMLQPQEALFFLAEETGGQLVTNSNDFGEALARGLAPSGYAYLLTVQVTDLPADGSYHPVEVRLAQRQRGVEVHHRPGYHAPRPLAEREEVDWATEAAQLLTSSEERDELGLRAVAVPFAAGAAGAARVPVVVEVPGGGLVDGRGVVSLELFGYAFDAAGAARDHFAAIASLDPDKVGARLAGGGLRFLGALDLPPGSYHLRLLARDRGAGRVSVITVPLVVPAAGAVGLHQAQALFVPRPDDPWLVVRGGDADLTLHGRALVPSLEGAVPRSGEADLVLVGHGLDAGGASMAARILDLDGAPTGDGRLELLGMAPGSEGEPDLLVGRLHAGALAAGTYQLELRWSTPGKVTVTRQPFRVEGTTG